MIFGAILFGIVYDLYAAVVLIGRLPRLRFGPVEPWVGWMIRIGAVAALLLNWAWLVFSGV